jgi:hypothetical protein
MTLAEKNIINSYLGLFESLKYSSKLVILEKLMHSLKKQTKSKEKEFFKSFGAFESEKSPEEIILELRESRKLG